MCFLLKRKVHLFSLLTTYREHFADTFLYKQLMLPNERERSEAVIFINCHSHTEKCRNVVYSLISFVVELEMHGATFVELAVFS